MKSLIALFVIFSSSAMAVESTIISPSVDIYTAHACGPVIKNGKKVKHIRRHSRFNQLDLNVQDSSIFVSLMENEERDGHIKLSRASELARIYVKSYDEGLSLVSKLSYNIRQVAIGFPCDVIDSPLTAESPSEVLFSEVFPR